MSRAGEARALLRHVAPVDAALGARVGRIFRSAGDSGSSTPSIGSAFAASVARAIRAASSSLADSGSLSVA